VPRGAGQKEPKSGGIGAQKNRVGSSFDNQGHQGVGLEPISRAWNIVYNIIGNMFQSHEQIAVTPE
jgi:uncharacterized membrane protein